MRGGRPWQVMLLVLFAWLVTQGTWALDTVILEGKTFYVLRSTNDWNDFCQKVEDVNMYSGMKNNMNAILAADFSITKACTYYRGIFDGNGHTINANISDYDTLKGLFEACINAFGHIDVMINNSGITQYMSIREATLEHFDLLNNVDWRGTFFGTQFAANHMIENGIHGSIINFSSCQKEMNLPDASVYSSIKSAIFKFTQQAALEFAPYKIRVNSISPGMIKVLPPDVILPREIAQRQRVPWQRVGVPSEISRIALFLADDASDYITGADFKVDGGLPLPAVMDNWRDPLPAPLAANAPSKK